MKWPQLEEALNAKRSRTPSAKSRASTPKAKSPAPPPPRTPTAHHPSPEALEALRQIGELMDKHEVLVEQVDALEVGKKLYKILISVIMKFLFRENCRLSDIIHVFSVLYLNFYWGLKNVNSYSIIILTNS